jgi:hypothetical protein
MTKRTLTYHHHHTSLLFGADIQFPATFQPMGLIWLTPVVVSLHAFGRDARYNTSDYLVTPIPSAVSPLFSISWRYSSSGHGIVPIPCGERIEHASNCRNRVRPEHSPLNYPTCAFVSSSLQLPWTHRLRTEYQQRCGPSNSFVTF